MTTPIESGARRAAGQAAQLWVGLARAAIAADLAAQPEQTALEPEMVAHAIDEHDREQAYDQVIVGYLLQIAREVRQDGSREDTGLQRRISKLVGSLQPQTLRRLLEMGGDSVQRRRFVLDASQGMTVDAVVELVQAAATAEGQTISHSLVRMLTKLASHANSDSSARSRAADGAFREHVERLVSSWSLDDPNPAPTGGHFRGYRSTRHVPRRRRGRRRAGLRAGAPHRHGARDRRPGPARRTRRRPDARRRRDRRAARSARRRASIRERRRHRRVASDRRARSAARAARGAAARSRGDPPARGADGADAAPPVLEALETRGREGSRQERLL